MNQNGSDAAGFLVAALDRHVNALAELAPLLQTALTRLDDAGNLLFPQALMLSAAALELNADVVLDLGTGGGNSATAFALARGQAARIYTFDVAPAWDQGLKQKLGDMGHLIEPFVTPVVGDIAASDFSPLLQDAERVLVFWDAHGYAIADRVLCHLMPLIADRPHLIICHDISDNRVGGQRSYGGKPFWRGVAGANENADTAYSNIGWVTSRVEQVIPILDFCWRNDTELRSLDFELHHLVATEQRIAWLEKLGMPSDSTFAMAYFRLGAAPRQFPASAL